MDDKRYETYHLVLSVEYLLILSKIPIDASSTASDVPP